MHKKAFTLTELLVVVVIIGVLSAVVLPKFSKMLETFKTGEAEELMAAVRNEQEARCALDKDYAVDSRKLTSIAKLQLGSIATETVSTTYYDYKLGNVGMSATRLQVGSTDQYTLKIPSYADGRICCEGLGCDKLSKDYPACNTLVNQTDYVQASATCAAPVIEGSSNPEPPEPPSPGCTEGATQGEQSCNGCGTQTTQVCRNGKWENQLGDCSKTLEECTPQETDCCSADFKGNFAECIGEKYGYESTEYICAYRGIKACAERLGLQIGSGSGGINIGTNGDNARLYAGTPAWAWGGYKRWACDHTIPCDEANDPSSESSCNGCGTRSAVYECDTEKGVWKWVSVGECSKTTEECSRCDGDQEKDRVDESNCEYWYYHMKCRKYPSGEMWDSTLVKVELKPGAQCGSQNTDSRPTTAPSSGYEWYCDVLGQYGEKCKWVQRKKVGGGGGGSPHGGSTTNCKNWTDMYMGCFCTTCDDGSARCF